MRGLVLSIGSFLAACALGCHGDPVGAADADSAVTDDADATSDGRTSDANDSAEADVTRDARTDATDATDAVTVEADADSAATDCTSLHGPPMVRVDVPGGGSFCIDTIEVTNAQFDEFLDAKVPKNPQPTHCEGNSEWGDKSTDATQASYPRVYVDWCDAFAYCKWAGKRLCGKIGDGSNVSTDDEPKLDVDEWTYACMGGDPTHTFPYGATLDDAVCNVKGGEVAVPSNTKYPDCHGTKPPFDAIYDLSGNVWEWEQACEATDPDAGIGPMQCAIRGGAAGMLPYVGSDGARCNDPDVTYRAYIPGGLVDFVGIRCCQ